MVTLIIFLFRILSYNKVQQTPNMKRRQRSALLNFDSAFDKAAADLREELTGKLPQTVQEVDDVLWTTGSFGRDDELMKRAIYEGRITDMDWSDLKQTMEEQRLVQVALEDARCFGLDYGTTIDVVKGCIAIILLRGRLTQALTTYGMSLLLQNQDKEYYRRKIGCFVLFDEAREEVIKLFRVNARAVTTSIDTISRPFVSLLRAACQKYGKQCWCMTNELDGLLAEINSIRRRPMDRVVTTVTEFF